MRRLAGGLVLVVIAAATAAWPGDARARRAKALRPDPALVGLGPRELSVLDEIARLRASPPEYAKVLEPRRERYQGLHYDLGDTKLVTNEGLLALEEAIGALGKLKKLPKLKPSTGMSRAAADHVADLGKSGATSHHGSDGETAGARLERYGTWKQRNAELMSFGWKEAADVVGWLLVDDGLPDRPNRASLLDPKLGYVGVACGPHAAHEHCCVLLLVDHYKDAKHPKPRTQRLEVFFRE
jgi:hypothetical protein